MMAINWIAVRLACIFQIGSSDNSAVSINLEYEHFLRRVSPRRQKSKQLAVLGIVVCNADRFRGVCRQVVVATLPDPFKLPSAMVCPIHRRLRYCPGSRDGNKCAFVRIDMSQK